MAKKSTARMASGLTILQEAYSVAMVELSNPVEAYLRACQAAKQKPSNNPASSASQLSTNPAVKARISALQEPVRKRAQITLEVHLEELKDLRDKAKETMDWSAAIKAEMARGKVSGLYVEQVAVDATVKVESMSDDQLDAQIYKLLTELGIVKVDGAE